MPDVICFSEPFSSISHLSGAAAGMAGSVFLVLKGRSNNASSQFSLILYSFCMVCLFLTSGIYHYIERGTSIKYIFRILDYCAIYAMIAGTFTPIHTILFRGMHRLMILIAVWGLALIGLTMTSLFFDHIPDWVSYSFYIGLGWFGAVSFRLTYKHQKKFAGYIFIGGVAYTIGAIIDFINWPVIFPCVFGPHEIFHVFVILGALAHWLLIYQIADYRVKIT